MRHTFPSSLRGYALPSWRGLRHPGGLGRHREADAADDLFVGRIRRLQGRPERQRDLVHAIRRARRADARHGRRDVHAGEPARVRHLRIEHDRGNPGQMVDPGLGHRRPGVGAEDERCVVVAADQQIHGRELAGIEARIAARQVTPNG